MQNQPICPLVGHLADFAPPLCSSGSSTDTEQGCRISQFAHLWATWLILHPRCATVGPHRYRAGVQNQPICPLVGHLADSAPPLCSRWGSTDTERGCRISQFALLWANWLILHPRSAAVGLHRYRAGVQNQPICPLVGHLADSAPPLCSRWGSTDTEQGCKISQFAHLWATWLILHPRSAAVGLHRYRAGVQNQPICPLVGHLADSAPPLCSGGAPPIQSRGAESANLPTCGPLG